MTVQGAILEFAPEILGFFFFTFLGLAQTIRDFVFVENN
jgi:hypothetical protein